MQYNAMRKYTFLFFVFFIFFVSVQAQVEDLSALPDRQAGDRQNDFNELKSAYLNIQNGNYKEAYPYFKKMQRIYPKEPSYNYYLGRCLLFLDKDPLSSIKYLRFASTKEVSEDVYYYLGLAYIKNYQFEKAIKNLQWFNKRASKKQLRELDVQNYLAIAQNGLYLVKYIKKPEVYSKELRPKDEFFKYYNIQDFNGRFVYCDDYLARQTGLNFKEDSIADNSLIYIPQRIVNNEVIYYSGKNEKRGDYDIFRITRLNDSTWSEPENLGEVINTPFDEDYPYLHSDGVTLYFASKGHYSMGGYDLYRSIWSWNTQEWSEPENLDFPINSPYNDILFVASPNKKTAFFASDRETTEYNLMVYKLKLNNSEPYIEVQDHEELIEYSKLNVNIDSEQEEKKKQEDRFKPNQKELVKIKNKDTFKYKSEYDSLLNYAINYQLKADSLRWVIDEKRAVFDNTEKGQERARLTNIIIELEREIYTLQKKADRCYERVREIEQTNLASQKTIYEDVKKVEEVKNDEKVEEQNIYVEPEQDSIVIAKLAIVEEEPEDIIDPFNVGVRVEKPVIYNLENPIPINETLPESIVYMIQLGAFSSEKPPEVFNGLTPLSCIKNSDSKIRRYLAGKFNLLKDAEKGLSVVRSNGFKDAYIVAFSNGSIIPVKNAVKLESKSIELQEGIKKDVQKERQQEEDELSIIYILKGQISASDSLLIDKIKGELAEGEDLYIVTPSDDRQDKNEVLFILIKSFSSYEKASVRKEKIETIVKREMEIHAFFAESQIPLEQARKITE
jgi:uncharacterized pyridoxamine 5'-phosphate oxidase family protein